MNDSIRLFLILAPIGLAGGLITSVAMYAINQIKNEILNKILRRK